MNRLFELICQAAGNTVPTVSAPRRPGDIFLSYFDISRAAEVLGWQPTKTIEQGIAETVAWFRAKREAATPPP